MELQPALQAAAEILGLLCIGIALALTTVYIRRSYAVHVIPMALSMGVVLGVLVQAIKGDILPTWELVLVVVALAVKAFGLVMILKRVQARPKKPVGPQDGK